MMTHFLEILSGDTPGEAGSKILQEDVHGQRSQGRQRKRRIDVVKYNMEDLRLTVEDTGNRGRPTPDDSQPQGQTERGRFQKLTSGNFCGSTFYQSVPFLSPNQQRPVTDGQKIH